MYSVLCTVYSFTFANANAIHTLRRVPSIELATDVQRPDPEHNHSTGKGLLHLDCILNKCSKKLKSTTLHHNDLAPWSKMAKKMIFHCITGQNFKL